MAQGKEILVYQVKSANKTHAGKYVCYGADKNQTNLLDRSLDVVIETKYDVVANAKETVILSCGLKAQHNAALNNSLKWKRIDSVSSQKSLYFNYIEV